MKNNNIFEEMVITFVIIFVISAVILFIHLFIYPINTESDYCHILYGNDSFYDSQQGKTYEIRSCDFINENGTVEYHYFSYSAYYKWRNDNYDCPKWHELNRWSCELK